MINFFNLKPNEKVKYILEADPEFIQQQRIKAHKLKVSNKDHNDPDFIHMKSSASTKVADIQGFTHGGVISRFWMLRKHFNSLSKEELEGVPFNSWDCLSL